MNKFEISTIRRDLDMGWVRHAILTSHWGKWMSEGQFNEAIEKSLCFGVYIKDRRGPSGGRIQVGFARVVTDTAVFSSIMDVFVREDYRNQGVGRILMTAITTHDWVKSTICILDTADADGFYEKFGFARRRRVMQRDPK